MAVLIATGVLERTSCAQETRSLLESRESPYNNIFVYRTGHYVSMTFGHNRKIYEESLFNTLDDRELPVPYTRFMTASLIYPKKINSILEIGSGGGRTAWYLHRFMPNVQITSVELDPAVVELARKYFGIRDEPNFHVISRDGRIFLAGSKERYDVILLDAYRGPFVPFHLLTKEFYQIVKAHLAEGGVVAQNVDSTTMLFDSAVKTMRGVFPQLDFYEVGETSENAVIIAFARPNPSNADLRRMADQQQSAYRLRYDLRQLLASRYEPGPGTIDPNAKLLTDDFAPVESLKAIQRHNQKWPDR